MSLINLLPDLVCSIRMIKRNNFPDKTQQAVTERKKKKKNESKCVKADIRLGI